MKQKILILLTFLLTQGLGLNTLSAASLLQKDKYKDFQSQISDKSLKKLFDKGGVDAANERFFAKVTQIAKIAKSISEDKKGFKKLTDKDRYLLIYIVNRAQYFTENIDGGQIHYFGLLKLYKAMPLDMRRAIKNSGLSLKQKNLMLETLKNLDSQ